ncbi:MAG: hypothetical protein AB1609_12995 [Bacillota bacterium]
MSPAPLLDGREGPPLRDPLEGPDWEAWDELEFDTPEEVEAVFRAQRRLSLRYGAIFFAVTVTMPLLHTFWRFWTDVPVLGGFTLAELSILFLYPAFCIVIGLGYAVEANRLEESVLGRRFARYYARRIAGPPRGWRLLAWAARRGLWRRWP